ncbi:MAG TPA: FIST N-terminal domain-containing protein [Baekduia sp.]|jgi:hypothetical protein
MTQTMERAKSGLARARRCRWADVGRSAHSEAATAGREAARAALGGRNDAGLLLVFASGAYDLPALAAAIGEVAGEVPVVGCSSTGEIDAGGPRTGSVVVLALGGEGFTFSVTAVTSPDPRDAGARAAACAGDVAGSEHQVLLLLTDGASAGHADTVRGAYSVTGAGIPLVGGVAGHPVFEDSGTAVIYGASVLQGAVVGIAIGSDAPLGIGVRHGWRPVGEPMLVTQAEPGRVVELDGRPAAAVYRERAGADADVLGHPLGLQRRIGEAHIRMVTLDDAADGSIGAAVPAGSLVWLMESEPETVIAASGAAAREAIDALGPDEEPHALVLFGCAARYLFLGDEAASAEIARVADLVGGATVAGLYTHGEIARTRGTMGFHNQTLVVLAIA